MLNLMDTSILRQEDFLLLRFYNHSILKIKVKYGHIYLLYIDKV